MNGLLDHRDISEMGSNGPTPQIHMFLAKRDQIGEMHDIRPGGDLHGLISIYGGQLLARLLSCTRLFAPNRIRFGDVYRDYPTSRDCAQRL